ncbi:fumarylacetoacetate hydrolase FahA [Peziza echinospora]|nr:fumarylacetoacetate hydrolase FahA [Peziza echinospora]
MSRTLPTRIQLPLPITTDFSLSNIPFGVFTPPNSASEARHICTAIGDYILDLHVLTINHAIDTIIPPHVTPHPLLQPTLNLLASFGKKLTKSLRSWIRQLVEAGGLPTSFTDPEAPRRWPVGSIVPMNWPEGIVMHLPFEIGDYTDFYAGIHHAYNVGVLFRGPDNALQPNYRHLPVGYHGRASTVVPSGTPVIRPHGQLPPPGGKGNPRFGPTEKLDFELELAAFVGVGNAQGEPIAVNDAWEHIFGFVLMNDWSARDVQAWEYVPLGPFLGKSFATTVGCWVVTTDALRPFLTRQKQISSGPSSSKIGLLPYLMERDDASTFDFRLEVHINTAKTEDELNNKSPLTVTSPRHLIFSFPQMLAHHTVNGCSLRTGDLLGSGTISGPGAGEEGSMLEKSKNGTTDVQVHGADGGPVVARRWLEDGDEVIMRGWGVIPGGRDGHARGERVGFGSCRGIVLPPRK